MSAMGDLYRRYEEEEKPMLQDMLNNADAWRARAEDAEANLAEGLERFRELDVKCRAIEEQRAKFAELYADAQERGNKLEAALGKAQAQLNKRRR